MGKKINQAFVAAYNDLDKSLGEKFGIANGGVTEYINRLNHARFAPDRDEVLPVLVKYRTITNKFTYEPLSVKKDKELAKADVKWVKKFSKNVSKKKDPLSLYLKKAKKYARGRKVKRVILTVLGIAVVAAAVVAAVVLL